MKLLIDGKLKDEKKTDIDTGYFYGYGVFETILVREGEAILAQAHIRRLNEGLQSIHLNKAVSLVDLEKAIALLRCYNGALKVNVSEKHTVYSVREVGYTSDQYSEGASLKVSQVLRNPTSPVVYIKSMNYMDNILELKKAREEGWQDVLFTNPDGDICETAVANIFFIKGGEIITPTIDSGLLDGILRQWVVDRVKVTVRKVAFEEIANMDGAFITNSLLGVMRVNAIGERKFKDHPMIHELAKVYVNQVLKV